MLSCGPLAGAITWVSAELGVPTEVRLYNHLFTVETPDDDSWESQLSPMSEEIRPQAIGAWRSEVSSASSCAAV
jgi:hypothetical protein